MVFRETLHLFFSIHARGQAEVGRSLAAMFQTAEVTWWVVLLPLWHPEKWETQDEEQSPQRAAFNVINKKNPNQNRRILQQVMHS